MQPYGRPSHTLSWRCFVGVEHGVMRHVNAGGTQRHASVSKLGACSIVRNAHKERSTTPCQQDKLNDPC
jgi:hypothetical protein